MKKKGSKVDISLTPNEMNIDRSPHNEVEKSPLKFPGQKKSNNIEPFMEGDLDYVMGNTN
jgi:hypothetical protein